MNYRKLMKYKNLRIKWPFLYSSLPVSYISVEKIKNSPEQ